MNILEQREEISDLEDKVNKEFILYKWNNKTKEFWFLGHKIDYVHNPEEWCKYLNDLVTENKKQKEVINKAIELLKSQEQDMMGNYFFDDNIAEQLLDILNEVSNE